MPQTKYNTPLRPVYETQATAGWVLSALLFGGGSVMTSLPAGPFLVMAGLSSLMALRRGVTARNLRRFQIRLRGTGLTFMTVDDLLAKMREIPDTIYMGEGFTWGRREAQLAFEISTEQNPHLEHVMRMPNASDELDRKGAGWIHGIGAGYEKEIRIPIGHTAGNMLIEGTTGAGKTRMLDLLVAQAVARGEAVIIIDPKGDHDLREAARRACEATGRADRFVTFHPAFPDQSARVDALANWSRSTEPASRIAAIIPDVSTFSQYAQMALDKLVQGFLYLEENPSIVSLRRLLEKGPDELLDSVLKRYFDENAPGWRKEIKTYENKAGKDPSAGLILYYVEKLSQTRSSLAIEGLINQVTHNREHFSKMVASLMPVLNLLTSGTLAELLSPDYTKDDPRPVISMRGVAENRLVVWMGLDSLSDGVSGSAMGSLLLADLAAVSGAIYNNMPESERRPVNIFIDEAAEVLNDPCIQVLNKGRGSGMRVVILTQTIADFTARLGSEAKARQVLANVNSTIALRTVDGETQKYVSEGVPSTQIRVIERAQSNTAGSGGIAAFTGSVSERQTYVEQSLLPPDLLGLLPDLQYFAKLSGSKIYKIRIPILTSSPS